MQLWQPSAPGAALALAVCLAIAAPARAQHEDIGVGDTVRVVLDGGGRESGIVVDRTPESLSVRVSEGVVTTIAWTRIRDVQKRVDKGLRRDPNASRRFFGPTGRSPGPGNGYLALYEIFFPMLGIGVGDFLTLAVGRTLVEADSDQLTYFAPVITLSETEQSAVAVGLLSIRSGSEKDRIDIVHGMTTFGPSRGSVSLGFAYVLHSREFGRSFALTFGADLQSTDNLRLITEGYVIPGETTVVFAGFRFIGEHFAADLGVLTNIDNHEVHDEFVIPWLGLSLNFGH
jgi:hypothetical protein